MPVGRRGVRRFLGLVATSGAVGRIDNIAMSTAASHLGRQANHCFAVEDLVVVVVSVVVSFVCFCCCSVGLLAYYDADTMDSFALGTMEFDCRYLLLMMLSRLLLQLVVVVSYNYYLRLKIIIISMIL